MNDEAYNVHLEQMRAHKLMLEEDDFNNILQRAYQYIDSTRNIIEYSSNFTAKPLYLRTEDITKSPQCEANKILNIFGIDSIASTCNLHYRKAGMFSDDQVENLDKLFLHPGISEASSSYAELVSDFPYL